MKAGAFMPTDMGGVWRLANAAFRAGLIPSVKSEEQAFMVLAAGFEAGLGYTATIKSVMIVNNRVSIWGDGALALVVRSPKCLGISERIEGTGDAAVAICEARRDGWPEPVVRRFSAADAKRAGLLGKSGPWASYTPRMLQMRARAFALRDAFPDLLMGLGVVEENDDIPTTGAMTAGTPSEGPAARLASKIDSVPDVTPEPAQVPKAVREPGSDDVPETVGIGDASAEPPASFFEEQAKAR